MKEKKKIDRLFQESFKDFEATPKSHVWKNIEQELQKKKDKKVIPFWWYKAAGVAAVLAVIFFAANFLLLPNNQNKVVNSKQNTTVTPKNIKKADKPFTKTKSESTNGTNTNESYVNKENTRTPIIKNTTLNSEKNTPSTTNNNVEPLVANDKKSAIKANSKSTDKTIYTPKNSGLPTSQSLANSNKKSSATEKTNISKTQIEEENNSNVNKSLIAASPTNKEKLAGKNNQVLTEENKDNSNSNKGNSAIASAEKNNSEENIKKEEVLEEEINHKKSLVEEANKIEEEKLSEEDDNDNEETNLSKWLIKPNVSPIYYSSLNGGNNIDQSLASNSSESNITMAYGVNFAYAISEKFKVRSGVSKVNMSYNVNNIAYSAGVNSIQLEGITTSPANGAIEIISLDNSSPTPTTISNGEFDRSTNSTFTEGALNQQLGYLEVPVEIEYALVDKRFGVNIIGGASTLFLNNNDVYIDSQDSHLSLGEANNLNKVSFTTNVGLGFDYSISKSFDLNLEPTFKYQLNTYNNNINNFKPYFFGVYTGFSFKF